MSMFKLMPLSESEVEAIHHATLRILSETGTPSAAEPLRMPFNRADYFV